MEFCFDCKIAFDPNPGERCPVCEGSERIEELEERALMLERLLDDNDINYVGVT